MSRTPGSDGTVSGRARALAGAALLGLVATVVIFTGLHLVGPSSAISAVHRTISEYALTDSAWAFNLGVLTLVGASVAVFAAAARWAFWLRGLSLLWFTPLVVAIVTSPRAWWQVRAKQPARSPSP